MADLQLTFDGDLLRGGADLALVRSGTSLVSDLAIDDSLLSAVIISLFTDRIVDATEAATLGDGTTQNIDCRGWWADATLDTLDGASDYIGSRLWLLRREKQLSSVVVRAEEYAREALQWLVDEGFVEAVDVTATSTNISGTGHLYIKVTITQLSGAAGWQSTFDYTL